jgi:hypothetical protein
MHPGNASRYLRRSPSNLPPLAGFVAPCSTPFLILLEHKTLLLRIRQRLLCATGRHCGTLATYPLFTRTSACGMCAAWDPGHIARRCRPLCLRSMAVPAVNNRTESHGPAQGPICASRHKKAHWHRRCDQSHSQTGMTGPVYPCETPNNKWVGPLFRRSVGGSL